jgi:4-amino-4-deoxy-L-arabinose transferase-like glycosyltransferase
VSRHALLLIGLCLLTFFAGLGRSAIGDSDEAFYAESAREMVERGDWVTPHYNYEYRFQKPILFYWLVGLTYLVAGIGEASARFPSALAGLGIALLTAACGRRWLGPGAGLFGGAIVATSFGYFTIARSSLPDLPLAFFITLATWALLEGLGGADERRDTSTPGSTAHHLGRPTTSPADEGDSNRRAWLLTAAAAMAFGLLAKGPVAVALPLLVVLAVNVVMRQSLLPSRVGWLGATWRDVIFASAVFALVAAPWYAAMVHAHGVAYLDRFFLDENLERFATDRYNEPRSIWFYVPIVLGGFSPWSPLLALGIPALVQVARGRRHFSEIEWRLLLWAAVPLVFYSLSIGKQPRYILPVLPPLALLTARTILRRIESARLARRRHVPLILATLGSAVILAVLAVLLHRARPLLFALSPLSGSVGTIVIVASAIALALVSVVARHRMLPVALTLSAAATLVSLHYSVYSAAGLEPVQQMARLVTGARQGNEPSGTYRAFVRNLIFYTGVQQTDLASEQEAAEFLARPDRVLCVMPLELVEPLERNHGLKLHRLGSVLYFNPSGVRVRTLLAPQPEHDLQTVVLVSNRPDPRSTAGAGT